MRQASQPLSNLISHKEKGVVKRSGETLDVELSVSRNWLRALKRSVIADTGK